MRKEYLKPESVQVECKFEGIIAASGDGPKVHDSVTADDDCVSYSNRQGLNSTLWGSK